MWMMAQMRDLHGLTERLPTFHGLAERLLTGMRDTTRKLE